MTAAAKFPVKLTPELEDEYDRIEPLLVEELKNKGCTNFTMTMVNMGNGPIIYIGVNDMTLVPEVFPKTYIPIHVRLRESLSTAAHILHFTP